MATRPIPSRDEWLQLRAPYVGASETAALLGLQADYQLSPLALYLVKRGEIQPPVIEGERLDWGNQFEDAICQFACKREGWTLQAGVFATDDACAGSSATLDRVVLPSADDEASGFTGPGALEAKNVDFIAYRDKWLGDEPPPWILIQLQDQLACSGFKWGAVTACIAGNEYYCRRYPRHDGIIDAIRKAKTAFWEMVRAGTPPAVDHFASTADALKHLYPQINPGAVVDLRGSNELPELCIEAKRLAKQRKDIEAREEEIKNRFRALLGANERARITDSISISRSVGDDTPDRPAKPGEVIRGRRGQDRLTITVPKELLAA